MFLLYYLFAAFAGKGGSISVSIFNLTPLLLRFSETLPPLSKLLREAPLSFSERRRWHAVPDEVEKEAEVSPNPDSYREEKQRGEEKRLVRTQAGAYKRLLYY